MKKVLAGLLLSVFTIVSAEARTTDTKIRALIHEIGAERKELSDAQLLKFLISPSATPAQNEPFTVFIQPLSRYQNANVVLSASLNGTPVVLGQPTPDLWIFSSPGLGEIRENSLSVSVYIENKDQAQQIRAGIAQLDTEIANLQDQIDTTTDSALRDQLIAERNAKITLKNDLLNSLEQLKTALGEETFSFQVTKNTTDPTFPRIFSLSPNVGGALGGEQLAIVGENLLGVSEVVIGGIMVPPFIQSSTQINIVTPVFSTAGAKDVEVRVPQPGGGVRNSIIKNGFFVGTQIGGQNLPPIAVAGPAQSVNFGETAVLDGSGSFDFNVADVLAYTWAVVSVPEGSQIATGAIGNAATASFAGDVPGVYVLSLTVRETNTPDLFVSQPSLTTVRALEPANRAPTISLSQTSLTLSNNATANINVVTQDPDFWQKRTVLITKAPSLGSASLSANSLTYTAGSAAGADSIELTVIDNASSQLSATASLSIAIVSGNQPPVIGGVFSAQIYDGVPLRMRYSLTGASDPDGQIVRTLYTFSDGGIVSTRTTPTFAGFHDSVAFSTPLIVTANARDNLGAETEFVLTRDLAPNATNLRPVNRIVVDQISGPAPLTVNFDASGTFDPEAQLSSVRWLWGDGSPEQIGNSALLNVSHTFQNTGTYNVRLRTRDHVNGETDHFVRIYVGVAPPAGGTAPTADSRYSTREVVVGNSVTMDASRSNDPNPNGGTLSYIWSVFDSTTCVGLFGLVCEYTTQVAEHVFGTVGNFFPSLRVTNQNGAVSDIRFEEIFVVNQGHAPRAGFLPHVRSGVVPLTVNFDAGNERSYDYDGVLTDYLWNFGDGSPESSGVTTQHTFVTPGVYFVNLRVTDNHGNTHSVSEMITADASLKAKPRLLSEDEGREETRRVLTNACGQEVGEACYELAKMYEEDGDAFTAQKLFERACSLGHQAACSIAKWMKW